jgi:hypothetical protein
MTESATIILVEDGLLLVCEVLEPLEGELEVVPFELEAEFVQTVAERVPPGMLPEHQLVRRPSDRLGRQDLVGDGRLQDAVLMDAGLVRESVVAHDGLVGLHRNADHRRQHTTRRIDLGRADVGVEPAVHVTPRLDPHHHLLHGGVPGAFADPVHGALDLTRARQDRGQAVGHREAEVVVAVNGEDDALRPWNPAAQLANQRCVLVRLRVTHGVRNVQGRSSGLDGHLEYLDQIFRVRARRVFGGELDVVHVAARLPHRAIHFLENPLATHPELVLEVDVARRNERVDARVPRRLQRLGRAFHVIVSGARKAADLDLSQLPGDRLDRFEIAATGDGKARFDRVHPQPFQLTRESELLGEVHAATRRLLAVAKRRVEDADHFVGHGFILAALPREPEGVSLRVDAPISAATTTRPGRARRR